MALDDDREMKIHEVSVATYEHFLRLVGEQGVPEDEWQYFALSAASFLIQGVQISLRSRLMGKDVAAILRPGGDGQHPK